jgi:hypothetical protein
MDDLSRVFLPLRSNIGWFQSSDLRNAVSNRVKESILLYDELYIEDGTFRADIVDGYPGPITWYYPPGFIPLEWRTIEECDLKPTDMTIGIGPDGATSPTAIVVNGNASTRFKIDYYEIFKNIELSETISSNLLYCRMNIIYQKTQETLLNHNLGKIKMTLKICTQIKLILT